MDVCLVQARTWFEEALTTATEEAKAEDAAFEGPQPAQLAKAIEAALFKHFGEAFCASCSLVMTMNACFGSFL